MEKMGGKGKNAWNDNLTGFDSFHVLPAIMRTDPIEIWTCHYEKFQILRLSISE